METRKRETRGSPSDVRLMLLIGTAQDRYGIDAREVVDVVPMVHVRPLPHAPEVVAGLFRYHGVVVPVIDLCCLTRGQRCRRRLSTRTVLIHYAGDDGEPHILGLLAENVTATARVKAAEFSPPHIDVEDAPYLGEIFAGPSAGKDGEQEMIQRLHVNRLLPEALRRSLFAERLENE